MQYTLPDGTKLELDARRHGRRRRRGDRRRAGARCARGEGRRPGARPVRARCRATAPAGSRSITERSGAEALDLIRHDCAHVLATAVMELYPGVKISIGPPIDNGFYYDFDFPEGVHLSEADFEAIERGCSEHIAADEQFVREDVSVAAALERFAGRAAGLQGRADQGSRRQRGRRDRLALHQRPVHRPVPRPARPWHEADQGVQAAVGRRRLLARGFEPADAHARLWDGVLLQAGPQGPSRAPRAGEGPRPPAPRPAARHVRLLRRLPGRGLLAAGRHRGVQRAGQAEPRDGPRARLRRGEDPADLRQLAVDDLRSLGEVRPEHVRDRVRGPADGGQADELPGALQALRAASATPTATCRCACGSPACCTAASRAARCTACCGCATSPRTTRTSSAPRTRSRRRSRACSSSRSRPTSCSGSTCGSSSRRGPSSGSAPTSCGTAARRR